MNTERLAGAKWIKSSRSNGQAECVEVAFLTERQVAMRDSKNTGGGQALVFTAGGWGAFAGGLAGESFKRS